MGKRILMFFLLFLGDFLRAEIIITIYPHIENEYISNTKPLKTILTEVEGFDPEDVILKNNLKLAGEFFDGNNYFNTVADIIDAFYEKKINYFPLELLKQVNIKHKNYSNLKIKIISKDNESIQSVKLPELISQRLLYYICDMENSYDCDDFVNFINFESAISSMLEAELFACSKKKISNAPRLKEGRTLAFYDYFTSHYGFSLSDELCISKLGCNGSFAVNTIESLLLNYDCPHVSVLTYGDTEKLFKDQAKIGNQIFACKTLPLFAIFCVFLLLSY